jgi:plasmid stabilization system protein ParE
MVFEVLVSDEALADLAAITGFIRDNGSPLEANRWLEAIAGRIASLRSMPQRCPIAFAAYGLGVEVRVLHHGSRNRAYRIYFMIAGRPKRVVRVLHVRHWARRPFAAGDLHDLL